MKVSRRLAAIFGSLAAAAVLMLWPLTASALTNLTYDDTLKNIQQTNNNPCVIGSPSCNNGALFPFTSVPGGPGNQNLNSPTYTVGQLTGTNGVGSNTMNLLIDVNQAGNTPPGDSILLNLVEVFINGTLQFVFNGPQTVPLTGAINGNGFSDAGLRGLDFTGFASTATVTFHIVWSQQTDGQESFFLQSAGAAVPEPSSLLLLGSGLAAVGLWGRKRFMSKFIRTRA